MMVNPRLMELETAKRSLKRSSTPWDVGNMIQRRLEEKELT
jgi:hypothetical protein